MGSPLIMHLSDTPVRERDQIERQMFQNNPNRTKSNVPKLSLGFLHNWAIAFIMSALCNTREHRRRAVAGMMYVSDNWIGLFQLAATKRRQAYSHPRRVDWLEEIMTPKQIVVTRKSLLAIHEENGSDYNNILRSYRTNKCYVFGSDWGLYASIQ